MDASVATEKYEIEFKEFLKVKLAKLKAEAAELESLINGVVISYAPEVIVSTNHDGYNPQWTWKKKIIHFLEQNDLTTAGIVSSIMQLEPRYGQIRGKVVANISAILSSNSKKDSDIFAKYKNERGDSVYKLNPVAHLEN